MDFIVNTIAATFRTAATDVIVATYRYLATMTFLRGVAAVSRVSQVDFSRSPAVLSANSSEEFGN
jgi:hypothetical protein